MTEPFQPPGGIPPEIPLHTSADVSCVWRVILDRRLAIEQILRIRFPKVDEELLRQIAQAAFDLLQLYPESFEQVVAIWQSHTDDEVVS